MLNRVSVRNTSSFFYQMCARAFSLHFIHSYTFDLFFFCILHILDIFSLPLSALSRTPFLPFAGFRNIFSVTCIGWCACACVSSDFVWKYCKKTFPINKIGLYSDRHHLMFRWLRATYTILVKLENDKVIRICISKRRRRRRKFSSSELIPLIRALTK